MRGIPAAQIQAQDRRTIFGYVEQSFHMVPGTVKDQITLYDEAISMDDVVHSGTVFTGTMAAFIGCKSGGCRAGYLTA